MQFHRFRKLSVLAGLLLLAGCVAEGGVDHRPPLRPGPSQPPRICPMNYAPVCAQRGSSRQTFSNSCQARAEGYRVISNGRCSSRPGPGWGGAGGMHPPHQGNRPGRPGAGACTREFMPVCAQRGNDRRTFPNRCEANRAGYRIMSSGQCR